MKIELSCGPAEEYSKTVWSAVPFTVTVDGQTFDGTMTVCQTVNEDISDYPDIDIVEVLWNGENSPGLLDRLNIEEIVKDMYRSMDYEEA